MKKIVFGLFLIIVVYIFSRQLFVDRSAIHTAEAIHWNNNVYIIMAESPAFDSNEFSFIGVDNADYSLSGVGDDDTINYLYASSFMDNFLFKKESFHPPTSGNMTAIYVNWNRIDESESAAKLILELDIKKENVQECALDSINDFVRISASFDKSLVEAKRFGYIGFYHGNWVHVQDINDEEYRRLHFNKKTIISCSIISEDGVEHIKSLPEINFLSNKPSSGETANDKDR